MLPLRFGGIFAALALLLSSCATGGGKMEGSDLPAIIRQDFTLSGTVRIKGTVKVLPSAVLTIAPGANLLFEPYDPDKDGVNDSSLVVEGGFIARGEPDAPIIFTSASPTPEPGDWLEVRIEKAEGVVLQYCVMEYARNGLHAHFCSGVIADCIFRRNTDAANFGRCRFVVTRDAVEDNLGAGISLRESYLRVTGNRFLRNRTGILFFEKDGNSLVSLNRFADNERADVRLGDFYSGERPRIEGNRGLGGVRLVTESGETETVRSFEEGRSGEGPTRRAVSLALLWEKRLGSFIDAPPVAAPDGPDGKPSLLASDWEGDLVRLTLNEGRELWRAQAGDVVDSAPLVTEGLVVVNSWDRRTRAFRLSDGEQAWEWVWPESAQDDHRQAAPVALPPSPASPRPGVLVGTWGGELVCLEAGEGAVRWRRDLGGALRTAPLVESGGLIWVGTEGGYLHHLAPDGNLPGCTRLGSPVRSTPLDLGPCRDIDGRRIAHGTARLVSTREGVSQLAEDVEREPTWTLQTGPVGTWAQPQCLQGGAMTAVGDGKGKVTFLGRRGERFVVIKLGSAVHALGSMAGPEGEMLTAGTEGGGFFLLGVPDGRIAASVATGGAVHGQALWDRENRILVFGSRDGILRAYRVEVKETPWEGPS